MPPRYHDLQKLTSRLHASTHGLEIYLDKEMVMINVIASIRVRPGKLPDYLAILKANVPAVKKEKGYVEYVPTVDIDVKLPPQVLDKNIVTILERWESLEALLAHLGSEHMLDYREKVKTMVENVSLKVLQEVN
jgi:quinol monooxygenase YgiN